MSAIIAGGGSCYVEAKLRDATEIELLQRTWAAVRAAVVSLRIDAIQTPDDAAALKAKLDYLIGLSWAQFSGYERAPLTRLRSAVRAFNRHTRRGQTLKVGHD